MTRKFVKRSKFFPFCFTLCFVSLFLQYVQTLEARLREAAVKNSTLLQDNESLRKQVVLLEAEVRSLSLCLVS